MSGASANVELAVSSRTEGSQAWELVSAATMDPRELRRTLGCFATGVTIITTLDADGVRVGLTANSFNAVSLDPPLVLWSLACSSRSLAAFRQRRYWAVHVLGSGQEDLSQRFASRGTDKFRELASASGLGGVPLLSGCAARFQCRTVHEYIGGDHVIFVGEVAAFDRGEAAPLIFHGGRYAALQSIAEPRGVTPQFVPFRLV